MSTRRSRLHSLEYTKQECAYIFKCPEPAILVDSGSSSARSEGEMFRCRDHAFIYSQECLIVKCTGAGNR